jgi:hypothetical protein
MSDAVAPPARLEARRGVFYLLAFGFFALLALASAAAQFSMSAPEPIVSWVLGLVSLGAAGWLGREAFRLRPRIGPVLVLDEEGLEQIDLGRIDWAGVLAVHCAPRHSLFRGAELYVRLKPRDVGERVAAEFGGKPKFWVIPLRGLDRSEQAIGAAARGFHQAAAVPEPEARAAMSLEALGEMARQTGDPAALAMHGQSVEMQRRNDEIARPIFEAYDQRLLRLSRRSRIANWILRLLLLPLFLILFYFLLKHRFG